MDDAELWTLRSSIPGRGSYVETPYGRKAGESTILLVWTDPEHKEEHAQRLTMAVNAMLGVPNLPPGSVAKLLEALRDVLSALNAACEDEVVNHNPHVGQAVNIAYEALWGMGVTLTGADPDSAAIGQPRDVGDV